LPTNISRTRYFVDWMNIRSRIDSHLTSAHFSNIKVISDLKDFGVRSNVFHLLTSQSQMSESDLKVEVSKFLSFKSLKLHVVSSSKSKFSRRTLNFDFESFKQNSEALASTILQLRNFESMKL